MKPSITIRFALCLLLAGLAITPALADSLTYDPVGNVATRTTSFGTTTYTYDAVNRLTAESGPAGNFSYSYDANGSRLSDSGGSYTYSATSNRLTARHGHAVTTDAAGNITADGLGHTYVYNQAGRMSEARLNGVLLASYDYDYRGLRNRKVTTAAAPQGAQTILFVYDEAGHLIEELTATGTPIRTYIWRDDTPLAQIEHVPSRKIIYFEVDHLNTPRVARDQAGAVVWMWESDAFGVTLPNQNPSGMGVVTINLRFPGQYFDQETGLHYNWQRYYNPSTGQYTQPDRIGLRGGSWTTYAYVGGNPLSFVDPFGLYHCVQGAICDFTPMMDAKLQCFDRCTGGDTAITSGRDGTHSGPKDPHHSGQACDASHNENPDLSRDKAKSCFNRCFTNYGGGVNKWGTLRGFGQTEYNSDGSGNWHFHLQERPGPGGNKWKNGIN
jgi:RHS repeat-associated protein